MFSDRFLICSSSYTQLYPFYWFKETILRRVSVVLANWIADRQFCLIIFPWRKLVLSKSQQCLYKVHCLWNEKSSRPNIIEWKDNIRWRYFYLHFASSQSIDVHRHWSRGEIQSPSYTSLSVLESRSHWQFFPKITSISNQMPWNPSKVIHTVTYKQAHFVYAMHLLTPSDKLTQSALT